MKHESPSGEKLTSRWSEGCSLGTADSAVPEGRKGDAQEEWDGKSLISLKAGMP